MSWIMTIAAGAALGYFLVQFATKNARVGEEETEEAAKTTEDTATVRAERTEEQETAPRARLHRSSTDKKLAGVCGGIAEYLKVDPSIVRLVTILLMLGWGSGILAYIVCALVLPEE